MEAGQATQDKYTYHLRSANLSSLLEIQLQQSGYLSIKIELSGLNI
jgi:hypothetical protein